MMTPFHHLSTSFTLASKVGGGHFSAEIASKVKETLNFFLFRLFFLDAPLRLMPKYGAV